MKISFSKEFKLAFLFCLITGIFVLFLGMLSDIYLGDETFHYRLATYIYKADFKRPLFDPLALTNPVAKSYYVDPMFWHYLLAAIWKITAGISKFATQIYQVSWLFLLAISTYLLGKHFRDRKAGLIAAILAISMPFTIALSMILHTDIPVAAASALTLLLLVKKRFFWAAVSCAMMTYVKRNSYMLLPAILIIALYYMLENRRQLKPIIMGIFKYIFVFIFPLLLLMIPEAIYRYETFGVHSFWSGNIIRPDHGFRDIKIPLSITQKSLFITLTKVNVPLNYMKTTDELSITATQSQLKTVFIDPEISLKQTPDSQKNTTKTLVKNSANPANQIKNNAKYASITTTTPIVLKEGDTLKNNDIKEPSNPYKVIYNYSDNKKVFFYDESNLLLDYKVIIRYFGIAIAICLFLYVFLKGFRPKDIILWLLIITYIPIYLVIFKHGLNVRYLSPLIAFIALIAAFGFIKIKNIWLKYVIICLCVVQIACAGIYTCKARIIPKGLKDAYAFIKNNTNDDARIMCSKNSLSLYTDRPSIWLGVPSLHEINYLFWQANEEEMKNIFKKYEIDYILVEKDKSYDDSAVRHTGGYPESFLDKILKLKLFTSIYNNDNAQIWKINL